MGSNPRYDPYRRHYKKDTRFLLDLYTLTYDSGETLTTVDAKVSIPTRIGKQSCLNRLLAAFLVASH